MGLLDEILLKGSVIMMLGGVLGLAFTLIMHILMPKNVLKTYFKEPCFRPAEITMFTGFPFGYIRTAMFMRALAFPSGGKKRGLENAYKLAPVWYCKASKCLVIFIIFIFLLMVLLTTIGFIRYELWK